jgi:methionine-rich copper-binding protein CopC
MLSRPAARASARAVLVLAVVMLACLGPAGPAFAHATLIGSNPAEGAVLQTAPSTVTLTFDDALAEFEPTVVVTGPDGNRYQSGPATIDGAELSSTVAPLTVAGAYTIAYRVVSHDGHPVEGEVHFELAPTAVTPTSAPIGTAASAAASSAAASSAAASSAAASSNRTSAATNSVAISPASPSPGASPAPTVTSSADAAATSTSSSSSSSGWSGWQWMIVVLFVAAAFLATMIVRRRMAASARAGSPGNPGD